MKLRLAQARDPMRAMNRPKPGTPAATKAISNTREMRTAAKTMLWDFELYLCLKDSCSAASPCYNITESRCKVGSSAQPFLSRNSTPGALMLAGKTNDIVHDHCSLYRLKGGTGKPEGMPEGVQLCMHTAEKVTIILDM